MKVAIYIALAVFLLYAAHTRWFSAPGETQSASALLAATLTLPETGAVAAAKRDLANRVSVEVRDITVVRATPRTWTDTCLGAPQPGEGCSRTAIDGYEVVLHARGGTYEYRTDETGAGLRPVSNGS